MISSSYFPPSTSSTPQRSSEPSKSSEQKQSVAGSPNFYEMPTTEILSSATTRSAFLQSLQRSREREERREKEIETEKQREREKYTGEMYTSDKYVNDKYTSDKYTSDKYVNDKYASDKKYTSDISNKSISNKHNDISTYDYKHEPQKYDLPQPQNEIQTNLSTPIMSRRRLSSSPAKSIASASTPIKPLNSATPASQSKLASHAFTMSRSSTTDEEVESRKDQGKYGSEFDVSDFKKRYEEEFNKKVINEKEVYQSPKQQQQESFDRTDRINDFTFAKSQSYNCLPNNVDLKPNNVDLSDLKNLVDSVVEAHTLSLKNDLQNLHIELIKQSVAQQSAFRSLLETYLPLTGKLMESLKEEREENGRLKMRIEELSRRF